MDPGDCGFIKALEQAGDVNEIRLQCIEHRFADPLINSVFAHLTGRPGWHPDVDPALRQGGSECLPDRLDGVGKPAIEQNMNLMLACVASHRHSQ